MVCGQQGPQCQPFTSFPEGILIKTFSQLALLDINFASYYIFEISVVHTYKNLLKAQLKFRHFQGTDIGIVSGF